MEPGHEVVHGADGTSKLVTVAMPQPYPKLARMVKEYNTVLAD